MNENNEMKEFENRYKKLIFEGSIIPTATKVSRTIPVIEKNRKFIDDNFNESIPNVLISLNNKMVEISHKFNEAGISMYAEKNEKNNTINTSFVGDTIIEDLFSKTQDAMNKMKDYIMSMNEPIEEKNSKIQEAMKVSSFQKFLSKIKKEPIKIDLSIDKEKIKNMDEKLEEYKKANDIILRYNLENDLVPALVNRLTKTKIVKNINLGYIYTYKEANKIVNELINPNLIKLGLESKIPELQEKLQERYGIKDEISSINKDKKQEKDIDR